MDSIQSFLPLILIFGIMYFLMIRPQQQKMKKHRAMVAALRKGDKVVTQGGVYGKVTKVLDDGKVDVEIASGVVVRVVQSTIQSVMSTDGASPAPAQPAAKPAAKPMANADSPKRRGRPKRL